MDENSGDRFGPEAEDQEIEARRAAFPVVGIGISAGSFASLRALFASLPSAPGAAFVVVSGSTDPAGAATVAEALNRLGGLPARIAADGEPLAIDCCHVAPDGAMIRIEDDRIRLDPPEQEPGHRGTIDSFLLSLAEASGSAAIAIQLAELDDAGAIGLARIKVCGGLALAEQPGNGHGGHEPRPRAGHIAGPAGLADAVAPLDDIAARVVAYAEHLTRVEGDQRFAEAEAEAETRLGAIAAILRNRTGHDFHGYKPKTFLRRVQRRMHVTRLTEIGRYVEQLRADADETQQLFQDLLIGVTQFFRDAAEFDRLAHDLIPELLRRKAVDGEPLRIWVLGCATGEEAYSIAILVREAAIAASSKVAVQIFATDIDARALTVARTGRYLRSVADHVTPERLARWFVREGDTYCVVKELREMCIFSAHSIIKDAPFSRVDLISCRNLLIYLKAELQDRIIPTFHFALREGGLLFLGPSENVSRHTKLFQPIDRRHRIFRRVETGTRVVPQLPLNTRSEQRHLPPELSAARTLRGLNPSRRTECIAERYAPAYVLVDEHSEIVQFNGRIGPFIEPASGAASLDLLSLVPRELRHDLRKAMQKARREGIAVRVQPLTIGENGTARRVGLTVEPLVDEPDNPGQLMVLFHDGGVVDGRGDREQDDASPTARSENIQRLEVELRITKDRLQATIEELESTNEELKSSNEEYQSINEELQSANEELETSREELQSVNEELQTVNGELAHRVGELARTNSDLKNLLESTQIATLFLDNDMRVKSFTPPVAEVFHLVDTDLGRPIAHIARQVAYPELDDDVRRVLRTLGTVERRIGGTSERQFLARVLPYRSIDNYIAGSVLTFMDLTETVRAEAALRRAEESARRANLAARIVTWELDLEDGGRFNAMDGFETIFGSPPPGTIGALLAMLHADDREPVGLAFKAAAGDAGTSFAVDARLLGAVHGRAIRVTGAKRDNMVVGVCQDVEDVNRIGS